MEKKEADIIGTTKKVVKKASEISDKVVQEGTTQRRKKVGYILRQAQAQAGKTVFFAFIGIFYALGLTGTLSQTDIMNAAVSLSFFTSITIILGYTWFINRNRGKGDKITNAKIVILESDMLTMNKNHAKTVDFLMIENVRQSNHFNEMVTHIENLSNFATMLYSYDRGKVLTINKYFENTFGLTVDDLNKSVDNLNESERLFRIITLLSDPENHEKLKSLAKGKIQGYDGTNEYEVYLKRLLPDGNTTFSPFKIISNFLEHATDRSIQVIFVDMTTKKSEEELLRMHYTTILEYSKELLSRNLSRELTVKMLMGMHNYQKENKRINIEDIKK